MVQTYLYEYVVVLNYQGADVNVSRERIVPVCFCAHLSSACHILHVCQHKQEGSYSTSAS